MARIGVSCPLCGATSELPPGDVTVHAAGSYRYAFTCPHCEALAVKVADEVATSLLVAVGVAVWIGSSAPWEPQPPASPRPDPQAPASPRPDPQPMTLDDLLDLHQLLSRPDSFERLVGPSDG